MEDAGLKVLGELLMLQLLVTGHNGRKGFVDVEDVEVVVVNGLVRLGLEDSGDVESVSPLDDLGLSLYTGK